MPARRQHPEDSVIVSIGSVRDMLAEEMGRQNEVTQPRLPVPMAVPPEVVGGVPSLEEVGASRQARWQQERLAPVTVPAWRIWRRRVLAGLVALGAAGATGAVVYAWRPPPRAVEQALAVGQGALVSATTGVALHEATVRHGALAQEALGLRARVQTLEEELAAARAAPPPPVEPVVAPESVAATEPTRPRARRIRRPASAVIRPGSPVGTEKQRPPRKARSLNQTDQKLDSLLNGL